MLREKDGFWRPLYLCYRLHTPYRLHEECMQGSLYIYTHAWLLTSASFHALHGLLNTRNRHTCRDTCSRCWSGSLHICTHVKSHFRVLQCNACMNWSKKTVKACNVYQINKGWNAKCDHALAKQKGANCCSGGLRMGFQTMGRRRSLSRLMFGLAFLIWTASMDLLSQNHLAVLQTVAPSLLMWWRTPQSKEGPLSLCLFGKYCMPLQFTLASHHFSQSQTIHNHVAPLVSVCYKYL